MAEAKKTTETTAEAQPSELSAPLAEAKQREYERGSTAEERKAAEDKPVTFTLPAGTKVAAPQALADKIKSG